MIAPTRSLFSALVFVLIALSLVVLQVAVGGVRLVFALPAFLILGVAGILTAVLNREDHVAPRRYCIAAAVALGGYVIARALASPVAMLARPDLFLAMASLVIYLASAIHLGGVRPRFVLISVLMSVAVLQVCVGIWQFKDQANFMLQPGIFRPDYGFKASGFFISPNHLATLLGMLGLLCLSISCWGKIEISSRAFAFYGFIVCLTGVALTGSRGGYYSIALGLLVFTALSIALAQQFNRPHFFGLAIATSLVLTCIVALTLSAVVRSEIYEKRLRHVREPGSKALMLAPAAIAQAHINPMWGTGAGTFLYYGRQFRNPLIQADPQHAHDEPLEFLAEYGWSGVVLAGLFLLAHFGAAIHGVRRVLRQKLNPSFTAASNELALILGAGAALTVALFHGLADFTFHLPSLALFVAFLFSILANPAADLATRQQRRLLPWWLAALPVAAALALLITAAIRWPSEIFAQRARTALRDHDEARALDLARRATASDPANADAQYTAGEALHYLALQTSDPARARDLRQQAVTAFTAGLAAFPQDVRLLLKLGRTLDDLGQSEPATAVFDRALAAAPASGIVKACVGLHWHRHGDFAKAGAYYREAQELGEDKIAVAGLSDLLRDQAFVRENNAFADLLPDPPADSPAPQK